MDPRRSWEQTQTPTTELKKIPLKGNRRFIYFQNREEESNQSSYKYKTGNTPVGFVSYRCLHIANRKQCEKYMFNFCHIDCHLDEILNTWMNSFENSSSTKFFFYILYTWIGIRKQIKEELLGQHIYGKCLSHKGNDSGNRTKNGIGVFRNVSPVLPTNPCISKYD